MLFVNIRIDSISAGQHFTYVFNIVNDVTDICSYSIKIFIALILKLLNCDNRKH